MDNNTSSVTTFNEINVKSIPDNVFKLIEKDWFLVTAGNESNLNTMTANWGGLGFLWNKNVCFIFVRPSRHTYKFIEENSLFTLSFFGEEYRDALEFCGAKSGRDVNKVEACGFTPLTLANGGVAFKEAKMIMECTKIHFEDIHPEHFLDPDINRQYPRKDYHRMYIGEIKKVYVR